MDSNTGNAGMKLPLQLVQDNIEAAVTKVKTPLGRLCLLGVFAGMFIACGAAASNVAMHNIGNVGVARLIAGVIFPVGLLMILFIGGELFTGDGLMILGVLGGRIRLCDMARVWLIVYITNALGAAAVAWLACTGGQFQYTNGLLGAYTIKVAMGKISMSFSTALCSGIMCNIFVCGAVLMAGAAKDVTGKVWGSFFPIMAFVVSGYEHCVANMYYISAGIFAKQNGLFAAKAESYYGYTAERLAELNWTNFLLKSALPVTLGNMIGGVIFIALPLFLIHRRNITRAKKPD